MADKKTRRGAQRLLTVREVMNAGDGDHSDGGGLMLRIRGDSAGWVFRYSSPLGRRREMGLGRVLRGDATIAGKSLTDVRGRADEARLLVARGADPIDERQADATEMREAVAGAKAEQKKSALTLARAARAYHARVIEPNRTAKHSAQWIASLENHVGDALWNAPIASIEPGPLLDRLVELNSLVPETAGRIRQRLDAIFDDAILRKNATTNPAAVLKRKLREVGSNRKRGHFRALPFAKVPDFWSALSSQVAVSARATQFLILTAARTSEVLLAEWDELDLASRTFRVPPERMKDGEEHLVDLTDAAIVIIEGQRQSPIADPRWVFPSPMLTGKPMSNMSLLTLIDRMGMSAETTAHGLRASFSTWANESGKYRTDVIEACLAHQESDRVRRAYNRAKFAAERRELLRDWSMFVTSAPAGESP